MNEQMHPNRFRGAVLAQLEATVGWVDREEVAWLRDNPNEPLGEINIDTHFDFGALLWRLNA